MEDVPIHDPDTGELIFVIPGYVFEFDGASIPWIGQALTYSPFHPIVLLPSGLHDYAYLTHCISRCRADELFYRILLLNGADPDRARAMYSAVRIVGRYFWTQTKADIKKLHHMYQMCRERDEFESYGIPAV